MHPRSPNIRPVIQAPPEQDLKAFALSVLETEARAVLEVARAIDHRFEAAVESILACEGAVVTCGIGKAGHIARKLSATLSSTGTPSHFLSPADAVHGDLGSVRAGDVLILLSSSGESEEIVRILSLIKKLGNPIIALTASPKSSLGRYADHCLEMGKISEACPLGLAPSASTTALLALSDALALSVMKRRRFTPDDFALYHPAGQLGRKLIRVAEAMTFRKGENLPLYHESITVSDMLHQRATIQRPPGAVLLHDDAGRLSGIFTDGDLRRLITTSPAEAPDKVVATVMHRNPKRISADALASEAIAIMRPLRIDELPVIDAENRPLGMIDIQDLITLKMLDITPDDTP